MLGQYLLMLELRRLFKDQRLILNLYYGYKGIEKP